MDDLNSKQVTHIFSTDITTPTNRLLSQLFDDETNAIEFRFDGSIWKCRTDPEKGSGWFISADTGIRLDRDSYEAFKPAFDVIKSFYTGEKLRDGGIHISKYEWEEDGIFHIQGRVSREGGGGSWIKPEQFMFALENKATITKREKSRLTTYAKRLVVNNRRSAT